MKPALLVVILAMLGVLAPRPGAAQGGAAAAADERRVALVVGNGAYRQASRLPNAANDADAIARMLRRLGFSVDLVTDQGQQALAGALRRFSRTADGAAVALFFYAGHGIQANDVNYLLPVDAASERPEDLRLDAIELATVLAAMQGARARLLLVDACRNNPLAERMAARSRGVSRGLARIETGDVGTLVAFATAPGATADDGAGANSPFTLALLEHLGTAGLEIRAALTLVRDSVMRATGERQVPWDTSSLRTPVYLAGPPPAPPPVPPQTGAAAPAPVQGIDREALFWQSIQPAASVADLEEYLRRFPDGLYAGIARNRIAAARSAPQRTAAPAAGAPGAAPAAPAPAAPTAAPAAPARRRQPVVAVAGGPYPEPGAVFRDRHDDGTDCSECPEMVVVPAGSFTMGTPPQEDQREAVPRERRAWSQPQTAVTVRQAFALGRTHVTRAQYEAFQRATARTHSGGCWVYRRNPSGQGWDDVREPNADWLAPDFAQTANDPVVCVSWTDAHAYAQWLSQRTGYAYRLPTDAEWEYAARAGTRTARWWGDRAQDACAYANTADRSAAQRFGWQQTAQNLHLCSDGFATTAPVASFRANPFALHDMLGNAFQWVEDCWTATLAGRPGDERAVATGECARRVVRGGGWTSNPVVARAGYRFSIAVGTRLNKLGFRVARVLPAPS